MYSAIMSNQRLAKNIYECDAYMDQLSFSIRSIKYAKEDIVSGGVIDRIVNFLSSLVTMIRKVIVAIGSWIKDRFRRDRSIFSNIESMTKKLEKLKDNKKTIINDKLKTSSLNMSNWTYEDLSEMIANFKDSCQYVSKIFTNDINTDIDNIFNEPNWFINLDKLKSIGIVVSDNGIIEVHQLYEDRSDTISNLGYDDVSKNITLAKNYINMFSEYSNTQHMVNMLMDLEKKLSGQISAVKKDIMVAEDTKRNVSEVGKTIKYSIKLIRDLVPILMNMFVFISRRLNKVLGTMYYLLKQN